MYIQFHKYGKATLYLLPNESIRGMNRGEIFAKEFDYVEFMEDILKINMACFCREVFIYEELNVIPSSREFVKSMREKGVFPPKWNCEITSRFFGSYLRSRTNIQMVNELYNTLIYLKQNAFFAQRTSPLLNESRQVYGVLGETKSPVYMFKTTIEMMFYDLFGDSMEKQKWQTISRWSPYQYDCFFDSAKPLSYHKFCEMNDLLEWEDTDKLQFLYACVSSPKLQAYFKAEIPSRLPSEHYESTVHGQISCIPDYVFATDHIYRRFECAKYLKGLYEKYHLPEMYYVKEHNVIGWLGVMVDHIVAEYSFQQCNYCGLYSLKWKKRVCPNCETRYAKEIGEYERAANTRSRDKNAAKDTIKEGDLLDFYKDVVAALNHLIRCLFVSKLRQHSFDQRTPALPACVADFHYSQQHLFEEFLSQDQAEYEMLEIIPNAAQRYEDLVQLFKDQFTPAKFIKLMSEDERATRGRRTLKKLTDALPPEISVTSLKHYEAIAQSIDEAY